MPHRSVAPSISLETKQRQAECLRNDYTVLLACRQARRARLREILDFLGVRRIYPKESTTNTDIGLELPVLYRLLVDQAPHLIFCDYHPGPGGQLGTSFLSQVRSGNVPPNMLKDKKEGGPLIFPHMPMLLLTAQDDPVHHYSGPVLPIDKFVPVSQLSVDQQHLTSIVRKILNSLYDMEMKSKRAGMSSTVFVPLKVEAQNLGNRELYITLSGNLTHRETKTCVCQINEHANQNRPCQIFLDISGLRWYSGRSIRLIMLACQAYAGPNNAGKGCALICNPHMGGDQLQTGILYHINRLKEGIAFPIFTSLQQCRLAMRSV